MLQTGAAQGICTGANLNPDFGTDEKALDPGLLSHALFVFPWEEL